MGSAPSPPGVATGELARAAACVGAESDGVEGAFGSALGLAGTVVDSPTTTLLSVVLVVSNTLVASGSLVGAVPKSGQLVATVGVGEGGGGTCHVGGGAVEGAVGTGGHDGCGAG